MVHLRCISAEVSRLNGRIDLFFTDYWSHVILSGHNESLNKSGLFWLKENFNLFDMTKKKIWFPSPIYQMYSNEKLDVSKLYSKTFNASLINMARIEGLLLGLFKTMVVDCLGDTALLIN